MIPGTLYWFHNGDPVGQLNLTFKWFSLVVFEFIEHGMLENVILGAFMEKCKQ